MAGKERRGWCPEQGQEQGVQSGAYKGKSKKSQKFPLSAHREKAAFARGNGESSTREGKNPSICSEKKNGGVTKKQEKD